MPWFLKHRQDTDQRVFPAYEFQSSKNRCLRPGGGSLQPQKEVPPPCPIETPITSNQPFNGNSGVRSESGCRREHKPFGMEGCLMKQQRCTQNSLEGPLWANEDGGVKEADGRALGHKKREGVQTLPGDPPPLMRVIWRYGTPSAPTIRISPHPLCNAQCPTNNMITKGT